MNIKNFSYCVIFSLVALSVLLLSYTKVAKHDIEFWVTTGDKSFLLTKDLAGLAFENEAQDGSHVIEIDTTQKYQVIDGFGYSLTGGSAYLINQKLNASQRNALLRELFSEDSNSIGISYLRISVGGSDLDDHVFSYDDLPPGQTDKSLKQFNLSEDQKNLVPILKQIIALNPNIKIMGSPWSAPAWMKTNSNAKGGSLSPEYYDAYARYFVKYLQGMAQEGITIDAITIQNEPENPGNTPSMIMTAADQANFVKNNLGPALKKAKLKTKILIFDHNCDHPEYPIAVLNDADAKKYINGSAFHLYLGEIDALSKVHEAHPDKDVYFTEQWTSSRGDFGKDLNWHTKNLIIGGTRNWGKNVLEWNLAADPKFNPHTPSGGCTQCMGALTIGDSVTRNVSYYIIGQASKFVKSGSVRIASNMPDKIPNVAFLTPEGKKILIVLNDSDEEKHFGIKYKGKVANAKLPKGGVGTFVWK